MNASNSAPGHGHASDRPHGYRLGHLGAISVTGADAKTFLQGQLTFDLQQLTPERLEVAGCNSSLGRMQAVLWLVERSDGIVLILPASMVDTILQRLRKYTLRAKVRLDSLAARLSIHAGPASAAQAARAHVEHDGVSTITWPGSPQRTLVLAPPSETMLPDPQHELAWRLADIRAGLPQVYPETYEMFVAQMLNLEQLDGISFDKGCYTGQEIIARLHYRGTVKRRMHHFSAACPPPPLATRLVSNGTHAGDVVDSAATPAGCELLAVVNLAQLQERLELESAMGVQLMRLSDGVTE